jgi:hypothetical protein
MVVQQKPQIRRNSGNRNNTMSNAASESPRNAGEIQRKSLSPMVLTRIPWSAMKKAAVNTPPAAMARTCATRWRNKLGSPAIKGKNAEPNRPLASKNKPENMPRAVIFAAKSLRFGTGSGVNT